MLGLLYHKSKSSSSVSETKKRFELSKAQTAGWQCFPSFDRRRCQTADPLFEAPVKVRTADELERRPCSRLLAKTYLLAINPLHLCTQVRRRRGVDCSGLWHHRSPESNKQNIWAKIAFHWELQIRNSKVKAFTLPPFKRGADKTRIITTAFSLCPNSISCPWLIATFRFNCALSGVTR